MQTSNGSALTRRPRTNASVTSRNGARSTAAIVGVGNIGTDFLRLVKPFDLGRTLATVDQPGAVSAVQAALVIYGRLDAPEAELCVSLLRRMGVPASYTPTPPTSPLGQLSRRAPLLDSDKDRLDASLQRAPDLYRKLARVGSYGSFFPYYICGIAFRASDLQGRTVQFPWIRQDTGRCAQH